MDRLVTVAYAAGLVAESRLDHGHGSLPEPRGTGRGANPACGDDVEIDVHHDGARLTALAQRTRGCAFTRGSASILARVVPGMTVAEVRDLAAMLRRDLLSSAALPVELGALADVRVYPARARCALLPWEALLSTLPEG